MIVASSSTIRLVAELEDLRAQEVAVSTGTVRTRAFPLLEQVTMLASFERHPWVSCLHMNGRVAVRDASLGEVKSLPSGGTAIQMLVAPGDTDVVAGTKNFRSWTTSTWKAGAFSWKSGFALDTSLLALGSDGRHVVAATTGELRVLDAATGERLAKHGGIFGARAIVLEDRFFVEAAGAVQVRSLPTAELLATLSPFPPAKGNALLARRPGTDRIVVGDRELRTVEIDARSLEPVAAHDDAAGLVTPERPRHRWSSWDRVYTPDGATSVTSYGTDRWSGADAAIAWLVVRETASGRELARLTVPFTSTNPGSLAVTPDGGTIFFALGPFYEVSLLVAWRRSD